LPAPLRSPGVTRIPRSYGCSDSCPAALRLLIREHEHRLDPGRSLCFMCLAVRPFRLQPPSWPHDRFDTLPLSVVGFRVAPVRASPFPSVSAHKTCNEFEVPAMLLVGP